MKKKSRLPYRALQRIKAQEYEHFFKSIDGHYRPCLNHLGELSWMTDDQAESQHEYFEYDDSLLLSLKKRLSFRHYPDWNSLSKNEKEIRLQYRQYLEKTHLGNVRPETARLLPETWQRPISDEEIENIPISVEIYESVGWQKGIIPSIISVLLLVGVLFYFGFWAANEQTGSISIKSNVKGAAVFLDGAKRGYADYHLELKKITFGKHRISLEKRGFIAEQNFYSVEVKSDEPAHVFVKMNPLNTSDKGYLKIAADHQDSEIYVDQDFKGYLADQQVLLLAEGEHQVTIEKRGYKSSPEFQTAYIISGDTALLVFKQRVVNVFPSTDRVASTQQGLLEITANISGAHIHLNGKDTGKETDHVFAGIPLGAYLIKVVREGYKSIPSEHSLLLTKSNPKANLAFELIKEFEKVSLITDPPNAKIFIDGKFRATGSFIDNLRIGQHIVSFGTLPGYKTPQSKTIKVEPDIPINWKIKYFPKIKLIAEIRPDGNINSEYCELQSGYTFENRAFAVSAQAGPEIIYKEDLDNYYWNFGFAFPFRNPKGNDALKISFLLAKDLNFNQKFIIKMYAASSDEYYPLSNGKIKEIKAKFNGNILSNDYQPKSIKDLNGMEEIEWDISNLIRPGLNSFILSTTHKNNTFYLVKKITIYN